MIPSLSVEEHRQQLCFMKDLCTTIIVTHDSEHYIEKAIQSLYSQKEGPPSIIIVDTGSQDPSYLEKYRNQKEIKIFFGPKECGFCVGNNIGYSHVAKKCSYVFFLNPDAFLENDFILKAISFLEDVKNKACAALTGSVFGYDISRNCLNGYYDTTGVFQRWYGKWYDRGQGKSIIQNSFPQGAVPAICAAVMFCRKEALNQVSFTTGEIFDPDFYMYKEDVDLSLRLRSKAWWLAYLPELQAYHCRGWHVERKKMSRKMRIHSAKNECTIHLRSKKWIQVIYSYIKYLLVIILDL